jgi:hypothetical protein
MAPEQLDKQATSVSDPSFYSIAALVLGLIGVLALTISVWQYAAHVGGQIVDDRTAWGMFGDFLGGFVGTIIALATLIALAITVHLQAQTLADTRAALTDQAATAQKQLRLIERTEALKLRPLLKGEWFPAERSDRAAIDWRITNVGPGPALVDSVELHTDGRKLGEHTFKLGPEMLGAWRSAISAILRETLGETMPAEAVALMPMTGLQRAIGSREYQASVRLYRATPGDCRAAMGILNSRLDVVIHFRSMAGEKLSTREQLEDI